MYLLSYLSRVIYLSCPDHRNPPSTMQDYITYYLLSSFPFINIGESITYQSWILYPRLTNSCLSHSQLQQVSDWNIQSCHGWWHHPRLLPYWYSPFQYPRAPRVLPQWSFLYALIICFRGVLSHDVGWVLFTPDILDINVLLFHHIPQKIMTNINVLCTNTYLPILC